MKIAHLDFETRSECDLRTAGLANYAAHPSTRVLCLAWACDDEPVQIWRDGWDPARLEPLAQHHSIGRITYAHNASFELAIWGKVLRRQFPGLPGMSLRQTRCTMAMCAQAGLPMSLENAAGALGLQQQKDAAGHRVMMQMTKPRSYDSAGNPVWWDSPEKWDALLAYCKQDVEVERALHHKLLELSDDEQNLWRLYQTINARGLPVDLPAIKRALATVDSEKARLDHEMDRLTGGAVDACSKAVALKDWLQEQGVEVPSLAKADVSAALAEDLPKDARRALELRQEAAKTSTAKLVAMQKGASEDGRVRGVIQHYGAHTGRSAGRRVQPLNMSKPTVLVDKDKDRAQAMIDDAIANIDDADYLSVFYGQPMSIVADCVRGMIAAPAGREFICCDYSNIEGRMLAWLAGETWKLDAFREFDAGTGPDLYVLAYAKAFRVDLKEAAKHRQTGKVMELALGYQGGVGAFQTMARNYGLIVTDERADELKTAWRDAHPAIVEYWKQLEAAAIRAVKSPGEVRGVGEGKRAVRWKCVGNFLYCRLPSGRVLSYPFPKVERKPMPWGGMKDQLSYMYVDSTSNKWVRGSTYGGSLAENITQAAARDILTHGILQLEAEGYPVVLEVYDEVLAETATGLKNPKDMAAIMCRLPEWAEGLPLAAEGWQGTRYRKD